MKNRKELLMPALSGKKTREKERVAGGSIWRYTWTQRERSATWLALTKPAAVLICFTRCFESSSVPLHMATTSCRKQRMVCAPCETGEDILHACLIVCLLNLPEDGRTFMCLYVSVTRASVVQLCGCVVQAFPRSSCYQLPWGVGSSVFLTPTSSFFGWHISYNGLYVTC